MTWMIHILGSPLEGRWSTPFRCWTAVTLQRSQITQEQNRYMSESKKHPLTGESRTFPKGAQAKSRLWKLERHLLMPTATQHARREHEPGAQVKSGLWQIWETRAIEFICFIKHINIWNYCKYIQMRLLNICKPCFSRLRFEVVYHFLSVCFGLNLYILLVFWCCTLLYSSTFANMQLMLNATVVCRHSNIKGNMISNDLSNVNW